MENHVARMEAKGWHTRRVADSEDTAAIELALQAARAEIERPSFIAIRSHIAYPAPHAVDTAKAHGAPLGDEEVRATKRAMGFDPDREFWVDERVYEHMSLRERGARLQQSWQEHFQAWRDAPPHGAAEGDEAWASPLRGGWRGAPPRLPPGGKIATPPAPPQT